MPQLAANLSLMYTEHPLPERFAAAAADGFGAVELLFPYELGLSATRSLLAEHGLSLVLFNAPPGDWMAGDRGLLCLPDRTSQYQDSVRRALDYAQALGTPRIHLMSGLLAAGTRLQDLRPMLIERLRWAAELAETAGCRLCLEPINRRDMPGYALNRQQEAIELIQAVGHPALRLQFDAYHCQIVEGDVSVRLCQAFELGLLEHVQIAGVPERHEPDEGELRVDYLLELLDRLGYGGHVGCEYRPRAGTSAGLAWLRRWMPAKC